MYRNSIRHIILALVLGIICLGSSDNFAQTTDSIAFNTPDERTGQIEDVGRFMGDEPVLERYLSLPYDVQMNANYVSPFLDFGFFLILFIPFIFLFYRKSKSIVNGVILFMLILGLSLSATSTFLKRHNLDRQTTITNLKKEKVSGSNATSLEKLEHGILLPVFQSTSWAPAIVNQFSGQKDRITYPLLFSLCLLGLWLLFKRFTSTKSAAFALLLIWSYYFFLWFILSSGIPWYGILLYPLGLLLAIVAVLKVAEERADSRWILASLYSLSALWLLFFFPLRFTGLYPKTEQRGKMAHYPEFVNYQIGEFTAIKTKNALYPQVDGVMSVVNSDLNSLVYGIGTSIPFFVERSDRRIYSDPFLDEFNRLSDAVPNKQVLAQTLKRLGFEYIILDIKLPMLDKTAEGTLKEKFRKFMFFVFENNHLELVGTDQRVRLERDGSEIYAFGIYEANTVVSPGRYAVYRIK